MADKFYGTVTIRIQAGEVKKVTVERDDCWTHYQVTRTCSVAVRMRAERWAGELLKAMAKSGERHTGSGDQRTEYRDRIPKLRDLGVTPNQPGPLKHMSMKEARGQ